MGQDPKKCTMSDAGAQNVFMQATQMPEKEWYAMSLFNAWKQAEIREGKMGESQQKSVTRPYEL